MTREEAVEVLTNATIEPAWGGSFRATSEALDMAIEALQTPPISQRSMYQAGYRQGREEALKQVTGKLNNPDDSLLTADPEACKEQKSKLDLISRQAAIDALGEEPPVWCDEEYEIAERDQWRADIEAIESVPSADRPRGEWISKEELIDAINDAQFVYDGDGHKEHDISELVRVMFKDIIDNLPSADMRGDTK